MSEIGVVMTLPPGREENARLVLEYLARMTLLPATVVVVCDGPGVDLSQGDLPISVDLVATEERHEPGREQPRNVGVRHIREVFADATHAWFLDSDILVEPEVLKTYYDAIEEVGDQTILVGPYEWMVDGMREPHPELHTDFRWEMFEERGRGPFVADLGVALGCFGGNLVWPIDEFVRVGGFHPQLHHGRCEDGELGLRAASHRIPMALVKEARGYHLAHAVNYELAVQRNARDVPLLNSWHPWVEQQGLIVTDQDGARFDFVCACGQQVNTLEMWRHLSTHSGAQPEPSLVLPEGIR